MFAPESWRLAQWLQVPWEIKSIGLRSLKLLHNLMPCKYSLSFRQYWFKQSSLRSVQNLVSESCRAQILKIKYRLQRQWCLIIKKWPNCASSVKLDNSVPFHYWSNMSITAAENVIIREKNRSNVDLKNRPAVATTDLSLTTSSYRYTTKTRWEDIAWSVAQI